MSPHWPLISVVISLVLLHTSCLYATPIHSVATNPIINDNVDEFQRSHNAFLYAMKNIVTEPNSYERIRLLNQLRESLNRLCLSGFFGASQAEACQHVADVVRQSYANSQVNDEDNSETSNEAHGIQKRFFCNGFIGCKNASG
jgi:hypothetical protein